MGIDYGYVTSGFTDNFAYNSISLTSGTYVELVDNVKNSSGTGPEAVYVDTLSVPSGATLNLNGLHLYALQSSIKGTVTNGIINQFNGTTTSLTTSSTNPVIGQSVTLTATVSIASPRTGTPTGIVTFYDGTTSLGMPTSRCRRESRRRQSRARHWLSGLTRSQRPTVGTQAISTVIPGRWRSR